MFPKDLLHAQQGTKFFDETFHAHGDSNDESRALTEEKGY